MKLRIVPARTGIAWVRSGVLVFRRQPLAMAALFFMSMAAMSLASLLPFVGPVLALALLPSVTLAMMLASAEALQGRFPTPQVLLAAFRSGPERLRHMLQLGLLYATGFLLVIALSALIDGGLFAQVYLGRTPLTPELVDNESFQAAMWTAMLLYMPLSLVFWHAPGLVHWHQVPPIKSLFFSWMACKRNLGAFVVYGLGWVGVFALGGVLVSLLAGLLPLGNALGGVMVALAMAMATMFFGSIVVTFRDCFEPPERAQAPGAPQADPVAPDQSE